jgi:hypothetical protein
MRPGTILWFERISLAAVIAGMVNGLTAGLVMNEADNLGAAVVSLGSLIVTSALIFRVSRRRSRAAKWILIIFTLMLVVGNAPVLLTRADSGAILVGLAIDAIQLGALTLLFTHSARVWLARDPNARPQDKLRRTFE